MATTTLQNVWMRPALMIFTDAAPVAVNAAAGQWDLGAADSGYLYLTDDARSEMQISVERIEYKKRMINGRMRSYHVADKKKFSVNWKDLPTARTEISEPARGGVSSGWASAPEMLTWHQNHPDSFYLVLVHDTPNGNVGVPLKYTLEYYNVFFEDFSYVIKKRGALFDLWDISMSLVEV